MRQSGSSLLVGPEAQRALRNSKPKPSYEGKPTPLEGAGRLPLVGPEFKNPIRKEILAARSLRSRLQAHSSMRKCSASLVTHKMSLEGRLDSHTR